MKSYVFWYGQVLVIITQPFSDLNWGDILYFVYDRWEDHIKWMGETHPAKARGPCVWIVRCVRVALNSMLCAIPVVISQAGHFHLYVPVHVLRFLNTFCCVAGSLTGPRPPHYADLDRDGHVVRGSFRGYHRGRGRVMHGKLMLARNTDVVSSYEKQSFTCLLFSICLVHIAI